MSKLIPRELTFYIKIVLFYRTHASSSYVNLCEAVRQWTKDNFDKDMNNKNPKWRQEMNEIAEEVARLQGRVHQAIDHEGDDEESVIEVPNVPKHGHVLLQPYDFNRGTPSDPVGG